MSAQAMQRPFSEQPPYRNLTDATSKIADDTGAWFEKTNEKYELSRKATVAGNQVAAGASSLWGRMKTMVAKKPADGAAAAGNSDNAAAASSTN